MVTLSMIDNKRNDKVEKNANANLNSLTLTQYQGDFPLSDVWRKLLELSYKSATLKEDTTEVLSKKVF